MRIAYLSLRVFMLSFLTLFFLTIGADKTQALECSLDDDCPEGRHCNVSASNYVCLKSNEPGSEPVCPPEALATGVCVIGPGICQQDADCGEGYFCSIGSSSTIFISTDCSAADDCPVEEIVEVDEAGICKPKRLNCETDSDCPSPTTCVTNTNTVCTSDETDTECEQEPDNGCFFLPTECEADNDCNAGYECIAPMAALKCSTGSNPPPPACVDEKACDASVAQEPVEEQCEEEADQEKYCYPKRIDCQKDNECENGWKCLDYSLTYAFNEKYEEDGKYAGPPWWQQGDETKIVACTPEGLVALFNGHIGTLGMLESDSVKGGYNDSATLVGESGDAGEEKFDASVNGRNEADSEDNNGGCTCNIAARPSHPAYSMAFIFLTIVYWLRRRPSL